MPPTAIEGLRPRRLRAGVVAAGLASLVVPLVVSAGVPTGIVDSPCPPPVAKPAGVVRGYELLIEPGALARSAFPPPDGAAEEAYWAALEARKDAA